MSEIKFKSYHFNHTDKLIATSNWGIIDDGLFQSPTSTASEIKSKRVDSKYTEHGDQNLDDIYQDDIIKIERYNKPLIGVVRQLDGGQWYIDHPKVNLKYQHQIHCEICDTDAFFFFLDFFDHYELEILGNIYENPELL